eukprot:CAMPEP_0173383944 /NCGR_PEP_ID=MMETSP1356-20130122/6514_1 /TAXON_ID=77927 ORGANISM="Hemiselmis virescens, Strain PCC157" /NCGR_SAMPLE_ID=MMETSP1356 /ASSEMBLY_ACC=CAM_ASM_000847 /LENGTH=237 /DNA_ID=CAMNT_0014339049 /DNA_START=320 /DNA_END=1033 /DNA_ORIENTATION=+
MAHLNGKAAPVPQLFEAHPSMHLSQSDDKAKLVHFVRHAEGLHNAAHRDNEEKFWKELHNSPQMWDACLTKEGETQCAGLEEMILSEGIDVDLIVVSPLTRTLQTAELSFGQTHPKTPMIAHELCRERIAVYTSEGRSDTSVVAKRFPKVDFSLVTDEKDMMFDKKEKDSEVGARAQRFVEWLMTRPEKRIAVVSHSVFLQQLYLSYKETLPEDFYTERQDFAGLKTALICYAEDEA